MRRTLAFFLCLISLFVFSRENNVIHKYYIEGGIAGGSYSKGGAAGVIGAFGTYFTSFGKQSAFDIRAKSLFTKVPEREVGAIAFTYRLYFGKGFYAGAGGAHNHEIALVDYKEDPVSVSLGIHKNLIHRTGFAAEAGYDFKSWLKENKLGIYPVINFCFTYLILDKEPNPLITFGLALKFGWKKSESLQ